MLEDATKAAPHDVWAVARPIIYAADGIGHVHYALHGWYIVLFAVDDVLRAAREYGMGGFALTAWLCPMSADSLPPLARALLEQSGGADRQHTGEMLRRALFFDEQPPYVEWYERKQRSVEQWIDDPSLPISEWARDVQQELTHKIALARRREEERRA